MNIRLVVFLMIWLLSVALGWAADSCRIQRINWSGEYVAFDESVMAPLIGEPCEAWKAGAARLQRDYENQGFLGAVVSGEIDSSGTLRLRIERGSAWVWADPENTDSSGTKPEVFRKLTGITAGDLVKISDLERSDRKLSRSGYFEKNGDVQMYRDPNRNRIIPVYHMSAASISEAEALLTYSSENEVWEGLVNVNLYNILGTARDLELEGFTGEDSRRLQGYYKEPWILGTNWNLIFRGAFDEDSSTREAYGEVGVSRDIGFDFSVAVFAGMSETEKRSAFELNFVSLDRLVLPRQGTKFNGRLTWNMDRPDSLDNYLKVRGSISHYVPVYGNWIVRAGGQAGGTFATDADLARNDLFALGGMDDFKAMDYRFMRTRAYGFSEFALLWQDGYDLSIEGFYMPGLYRALRPGHGWKREQEYGLAFTQYRKNWNVNFYYALRNGESYLDGIVGVGVKTLF